MVKGRKRPLSIYKIAGNIVLAAALLIGAYLANNYFYTYPVIVSVLKGGALLSALAMAEAIVLATGGIDLSLASVSLLSSSTIFYLVETLVMGVVPAVLTGIVAGAVMGLINGVFISKIGLMSVITTMGTGLLAQGISGAITNNIIIFDTRPEFEFFKSVSAFVIPTSLIIALFIMVCCFLLFRYTVAGRQVFAVGGSERSAQLSGLNIDRIKILAYTGAGFLAGIGSLMVLADSAIAARFYGGGAAVQILLAAIIGGVSLYSGAKMFFRGCVGAGIIAVLNRLIYGLFVFNYMSSMIIAIVLLLLIAIRKSIFKRENKS